MAGTKRKYDEEFKKDAVKLTYGSSKGVAEIAIHPLLIIRIMSTFSSPGTPESRLRR
jgi:hypothetical protein